VKELRYTLLSDGSSDQTLLPVLTWLLRAQRVSCAIQSQWADLRRLPKPPQTLADKIHWSIELYPCDLLFVHRDAEKFPHQVRVAEIQEALTEAKSHLATRPAICVVPVRMTEAWLLFDETALRHAAGNPQGWQTLDLPALRQIEQEPDPKSRLNELLREASGLSGRRRRQLNVSLCTRRLAEFISDFATLRALPAFNALEADVQQVIKARAWDTTGL
jgi:hypothetical protein